MKKVLTQKSVNAKVKSENVKRPMPIYYNDLPDKELLRHILKMVNPLMKAIILFMTSSGCAKRETLNITVHDFIDATYDYHHKDNIDDVIEALIGREDVVPSWRLRRQKTNKYQEDPLRLREKYIEHRGAVTINLDVEMLSIKSPEFQAMETENQKLNAELDGLKGEIDYIKKALRNTM